MFSETALPALFGHIVALLHNPNNISGESSRIGVLLEDEAVACLAAMAGFPEGKTAGHFTSGGTVANFEALLRARARTALWLALGAARQGRREKRQAGLFESAHQGWGRFDESARELGPDLAGILSPFNFTEGNPWAAAARIGREFGRDFEGPVVLVPGNKHYSWQKGVSILGLGQEAFWAVDLDDRGKLSVRDLDAKLERARARDRPVMLVVSVAGTTELGEFDPVDEVDALLDRWRRERGIDIWHHVDAAFGGFFRAQNPDDRASMGEAASRALEAMGRAQSITLDPHKLG